MDVSSLSLSLPESPSLAGSHESLSASTVTVDTLGESDKDCPRSEVWGSESVDSEVWGSESVGELGLASDLAAALVVRFGWASLTLE
jgi:hypothetical protein